MFDLGKWQGKTGFINERLFISINMLEGSDIYIKITLFLKLLSLDFYINYDECFVAFNCQVLADVLFLITFSFMIKIFFHVSISISRGIDLLLVLMISSYFKIFLVAMMVWEFPSSVIFIIELFCLSSNAVALKVMTESTMSRCVWTCFFAYAIKFLVTRILELILLGQLMQGWSQMSISVFKASMI
ncbi:hypothetical protein ACSQ67_001086 [Phaseolus vulgaris]